MEMIKGLLTWKRIKRKCHIDYKTVVLVLCGENKALEHYCVLHLSDYIKRRYAEKAILLYMSGMESKIAYVSDQACVKCVEISKEDIECLYQLYSFYKFFESIVFTYTDKPKDNLLQRYLDETDVNEEDAACLALYHLRHIPQINKARGTIYV